MQRKANGKIREILDVQVVLELPLPIETYWQVFLRQSRAYHKKLD